MIKLKLAQGNERDRFISINLEKAKTDFYIYQTDANNNSN